MNSVRWLGECEQRRTVIVVVAALGVALVLVLAASTGPEGVIGDRSADDSIRPNRAARA